MSVLIVGVSHRTAPVSLLEHVAFDEDAATKLVQEISHAEHVTEVALLTTCNRCEAYAEVDRFHGSVEVIAQLLADQAGVAADDLLPHLYVHYDDAAVSHLFSVSAGLDSMVVGESQILGQVRETLRTGQSLGTVGPALNVLFQQALRVGKRAHAETDIDHAAPSVVSAAFEVARSYVGDLAGKRAVVVGAGSMAGLSAATLVRAGVTDLVIANRTLEKGQRLAASYDGRAVALGDLGEVLHDADLVVSATGSPAVVLESATLAAARAGSTRPLVITDLAMPHDVAPEVEQLEGVHLIALATLAEELQDGPVGGDIEDVCTIVGEEISAFLASRRAASVTPTVVALRSMATEVVDAELARLGSRLPGLDEFSRAEVEQAIRRVADKLLHHPTVRVRELANEAGAVSYTDALARLFALDPDDVAAVTQVERP
jgi:glutamyl-tRNA reductase